jgi:hypothetical protein
MTVNECPKLPGIRFDIVIRSLDVIAISSLDEYIEQNFAKNQSNLQYFFLPFNKNKGGHVLHH